MPIDRVCIWCSVTFKVPPSLFARKYCGSECKYAHYRETGWPRENGWDKHCEVCKAKFRVTPSSSDSRFCSQACMLVWRGPVLREKRYVASAHVIRTCKQCGMRFETHACRVKDGVRGAFCSRSCLGAWTVESFGSTRASKVENEFAEALVARGFPPSRHARIGRWTVDCLYESARVVVEFDGDYWHSLPRVVDVDKRKDADLMRRGYSVLRVKECDFRSDPSSVVQTVIAALDCSATRVMEAEKAHAA